MAQAQYLFESPQLFARDIELGVSKGRWTTTIDDVTVCLYVGFAGGFLPALLTGDFGYSMLMGLLISGGGWFLISLCMRAAMGPSWLWDLCLNLRVLNWISRLGFGYGSEPGVCGIRRCTVCTWRQSGWRDTFRGKAPLAQRWPDRRWRAPLGLGYVEPQRGGGPAAPRSLVSHVRRKL